MGTFLSASGIIGCNAESVVEGIAAFVATVGGSFESRPGESDDRNVCIIQSTPKTTTALYPSGFVDWNELSKFLSLHLAKPVFSFHIHDGDLWMFIAFENGQEVAWFNPIPDYWEGIPDEEYAKWAGDAYAVARLVPGVAADSIEKYFCIWTDDVVEAETKAYHDDEFAIGVDWQLTDFMRRLGFTYPIDERGQPSGDTYYLKIRRQRLRSSSTDTEVRKIIPAAQSSGQSIRKPWWKIW